MRKTVKYVAWAVLIVGVVIPAVPWWADGGNRSRLLSRFVSPAKQPVDEGGIRVQAVPIQGVDVAAAFDLWMWKFAINIPADMTHQMMWLVVKRRARLWMWSAAWGRVTRGL